MDRREVSRGQGNAEACMLSMLSRVHEVEVATEIEYHSARINGQLVIVICIYSQCKNRIYQINPKA